MKQQDVALTQLARSAGCAAKIGQADLRAALSRLPDIVDARVIVGHSTGDDAAVVRLADDLALVETVDVFPPIVDDPYDYGRIAAANALSDIYAMGAKPLSALSFIAWPVDRLGLGCLGRVLEGAASICASAGIAIAGGHSIVDDEPKFGLFVTGLVHPDAIVTNAGARPGDFLVLTKPIGTGVLTTAAKRGRLQANGLANAIESMATLNREAAEAMVAAGVKAATDVTGFGLLGHLGTLLRASGERMGRNLGAQVTYDAVPIFDGVESFLAEGLCPGGTRRNLQYAAPHARFATEIDELRQLLLADAQTSGGLLMAVNESRLEQLLADLKARQTCAASVIGRVVQADRPGNIDVSR
ncbi:MAG: selenide, water dikinase SelD [Pseudorhodoplanes sp.]|nr:selenide, water dikinase SelD [Pseudorhodoplanes sp.]